MSLTPSGNVQKMKGQQVRPSFRVDLSPLLKIVEAQSKSNVKVAQPVFHPAGPDGGDKTKPSSGGGQQKPAPRPTIQQGKVGPGAPAPTGGAVAEPPQGAEPVETPPPAQIDKANPADPAAAPAADPAAAQAAQPQQPQKSPQDEKKEALEDADMFDELGQALAKFVKEKGMACGFDSKADGVTLSVVVQPLVRAPDGQMYEGEAAYLEVRREIRQMVRGKGLIAEGGTQPVALESLRQIDPKNKKTTTYQLTIKRPGGGKGEAGNDANHHSNIGFVPKGAKPVNGDGQVRPNSRMGQPPEAKPTDSEAMFGGQGIGGMGGDGEMGAQTLPNILASKKDEIVAALKKILGGH